MTMTMTMIIWRTCRSPCTSCVVPALCGTSDCTLLQGTIYTDQGDQGVWEVCGMQSPDPCTDLHCTSRDPR